MRSDSYMERIFGRILKVVQPFLQGGLAPEEIALAICLGSAIGTLPLLWGTTLMCACLAAFFRLNQAAMQAVNYLVYPLQLALFIPFSRLGGRLLPWGPVVSPEMSKQALHGSFVTTVNLLGWTTLRAASAWLITVPPAALILYLFLVPLLRRRQRVRLAP